MSIREFRLDAFSLALVTGSLAPSVGLNPRPNAEGGAEVFGAVVDEGGLEKKASLKEGKKITEEY